MCDGEAIGIKCDFGVSQHERDGEQVGGENE
jgi:hypothetical protein